MIPGQLGPTMRDLFWDLSMSVMRTMSVNVSLKHLSVLHALRTMLWDTLGDTARC